MTGCPHGDRCCPCQDGDSCHYEGDHPSVCPTSGLQPCTTCPATRTTPGHPWPAQPLLDAAGLTAGQLGKAVAAGGTVAATAVQQGLTTGQADRWAVALGLHPAEIFDGWYTQPHPCAVRLAAIHPIRPAAPLGVCSCGTPIADADGWGEHNREIIQRRRDRGGGLPGHRLQLHSDGAA